MKRLLNEIAILRLAVENRVAKITTPQDALDQADYIGCLIQVIALFLVLANAEPGEKSEQLVLDQEAFQEAFAALCGDE